MAQPRRLDLRSLLTRAEAAAPVGVVDALAGALLEMLDAREVSFLIVDLSGRSLNRLGHTAASEEPGSRSEETSGRVTLQGTPYGAALELGDPLALLDHPLLQPRDLLIHPHQDGRDRLTTLLIDRLGVRALHDS